MAYCGCRGLPATVRHPRPWPRRWRVMKMNATTPGGVGWQKNNRSEREAILRSKFRRSCCLRPGRPPNQTCQGLKTCSNTLREKIKEIMQFCRTILVYSPTPSLVEEVGEYPNIVRHFRVRELTQS